MLDLAGEGIVVGVHHDVEEEGVHHEDLIVVQEAALVLRVQHDLDLGHIGPNQEDGGGQLHGLNQVGGVLDQQLDLLLFLTWLSRGHRGVDALRLLRRCLDLLLLGEDGALDNLVGTLQGLLDLDRLLLGCQCLHDLLCVSALVDLEDLESLLDAGSQVLLAPQLLLGVLIQLGVALL